MYGRNSVQLQFLNFVARSSQLPSQIGTTIDFASFAEQAGVLYFPHFLGNQFLTFINNVLTDLNLTDVETGYKASRVEIAKNMIVQSSGFGLEIEFVAKCKKLDARVDEVPISYYGRTYEEGKRLA